MFDNILLEPVQKDLFIKLVKSARNVPVSKREKFYVIQTMGETVIQHPGILDDEIQAYLGDVEILSDAGLLNLNYSTRGTPNFDITPFGFKYYDEVLNVENKRDVLNINTFE